MSKAASTQFDGSRLGLTFADIYDYLMIDIEPELTTAMLPMLSAIYEKETEEQKIERGKRYQEAFEKLSEKMSTIQNTWKDELIEMKESVISQLKEEASAEDAAHLSEIEESFQDDQS